MAPRSGRLKTLTGPVLAAWYVALLLPTLAFKLLYISVQSGGDPRMIEPAGASAHISIWWLYVAYFLPADFLDVLAIVAIGAVAGVLLLRIPVRYVVAASVLLCLIVGGVDAVSFRLLLSFPTLQTIREGGNWAALNPDLMAALFTPRHVIGALAAIGWTYAAFWIVRRAGTSRWTLPRGIGVTLTIVLLVYAVARGGRGFVGVSERQSLITGFWSASLQALLNVGQGPELGAPARSSADLRAEYERLAYPAGRKAPEYIVDVPAEQRVPRHVIVLVLETAPRAFYRLADDPRLPVFHAMSAHAVIGDRHYTTAPMTELAVYSMASGTYPSTGGPLSQFGEFSTDGLAEVARNHGYETTFIDSYYLTWNGPDGKRTVRDLGFNTVLDDTDLVAPPQPTRYASLVAQESRSFDEALARVSAADARHNKSLVFVATHLGHATWVARDERTPARERIQQIAEQLDDLTGQLLKGLADRGLSDDTMIVVVGDHGLRVDLEFDAVNEPAQYGDITFQVPLMIYAPALFPSEIRLPYATSHADLAPTLLYLLGLPSTGLFHGDNMLDRGLANRLTFLMSGTYPGLRPVDGFTSGDQVYTLYDILGRVTVRTAGTSVEEPVGEDPGVPFTASAVKRLIDRAKMLFNATASNFLQRAKSR